MSLLICSPVCENGTLEMWSSGSGEAVAASGSGSAIRGCWLHYNGIAHCCESLPGWGPNGSSAN